MRRLARFLALVAIAMSATVMASCAGSGTAYVGVYGPPVYGPAYGPWGAYPYPGRYPPYGGGWVGVPICCYDQEQEQEQNPQQEALLTWAPDLRDGEDGPPIPFDLPRTR
jgi:hypothetical protein